MSRYDTSFPIIFCYGPLDEFNQALLYSEFDASVSRDNDFIAAEKKELKLYKRLVFLNLLIFPFIYSFMNLFISKNLAKQKANEAAIQWKFFRNKININEFKRKAALFS